MINKKGLSMVVTSLIIILLVLVAIGIIWVVVQNIITEGTEQVSLGKFTINLEIRSAKINTAGGIYDSFDVVIKRNPGEGELIGVNFVATDINGISEVFENMTIIQQLGSQTFNLIMTDFNASDVNKISIAPILMTSAGGKYIGNEVDEIDGSRIDKSAVGM